MRGKPSRTKLKWPGWQVSFKRVSIVKSGFGSGDRSKMRDRFIMTSKKSPESPDPSPLRRFSTHPFLQDLLVSNCSLIMPTIISSETRPPASIIFFASIPRAVFLWTCSRSISPVAKWQTQYLSRMLGACVPLPK